MKNVPEGRGDRMRWLAVRALLCLAAQVSVPFAMAQGTIADSEVVGTLPDPSQPSSLESRVVEASQQVERLGHDADQLQRRIVALVERVHAIQSPEKPLSAEPPKREKQKVVFRPPLERSAGDRTPVGIVCENGRLSLFEFTDVNEVFKRQVLPLLKSGATVREEFSLGDSEFNLLVIFDTDSGTAQLARKGDSARPAAPPSPDTAVTMRAHWGESAADLATPTSRVMRRLQAMDKSREYLNCAVYPDSYEVFRAVRAAAWKLGLDYDWTPFESSQPVRFGAGAGVTQ